MPARILLADKSITIQKVVEMLFSGREYEVMCVSDGEMALSEAGRVPPDVVLADVDLPRVDGYSLAARIKKIPALAQTPVILMMSRDDVYDAERGKQAGIVDNIAKPFESQELIGKVKKALVAAPPRPAEPPVSRPVAPTAPIAMAAPRTTPAAVKPKPAAPTDIFDIINEAPTPEDRMHTDAPDEEDSVYEVEPVVEEVEEPLAQEMDKALPTGAKAMEEMRAGLGLTGDQEELQPEIATLESFGMARETAEKFVPAPQPVEPVSAPARSAIPPPAPAAKPVQPAESPGELLRSMVDEKVPGMEKEAWGKMPVAQPSALSESDMWSVAEEAVQKIAKEFFEKQAPARTPQISDDSLKRMVKETAEETVKEALAKMPVSPQQTSIPEGELRSMAEATLSRMALDVFNDMTPPIPKISDETVRRGIEDAIWKIAHEVAKEVIEQVAWEVIPRLAEHLIKQEIERLKAEP